MLLWWVTSSSVCTLWAPGRSRGQRQQQQQACTCGGAHAAAASSQPSGCRLQAAPHAPRARPAVPATLPPPLHRWRLPHPSPRPLKPGPAALPLLLHHLAVPLGLLPGPGAAQRRLRQGRTWWLLSARGPPPVPWAQSTKGNKPALKRFTAVTLNIAASVRYALTSVRIPSGPLPPAPPRPPAPHLDSRLGAQRAHIQTQLLLCHIQRCLQLLPLASDLLASEREAPGALAQPSNHGHLVGAGEGDQAYQLTHR